MGPARLTPHPPGPTLTWMLGPTKAEAELRDELLSSVGHMVSVWQGIEHVVFEVFRSFFTLDHSDVAATIFFTTPSFGSRLDLADKLITAYCDHSAVKRWRELKKEIGPLSTMRNRVAHGVVGFIGESPHQRPHLARSIYDIHKFPDDPTPDKFIAADAVQAACVKTGELIMTLQTFRQSLERDYVLQKRLRQRPQQVERNSERHPMRLTMSGDALISS